MWSHRCVRIHVEVTWRGINNDSFCRKRIPCLVRTLRTEWPIVRLLRWEAHCLPQSPRGENSRVGGLWPFRGQASLEGIRARGIPFHLTLALLFWKKENDESIFPTEGMCRVSPPPCPPAPTALRLLNEMLSRTVNFFPHAQGKRNIEKAL